MSTLRPTQASTFSQVERGLLANFGKLVRAQEQIATGKRILRASDDPTGAARAFSFRRHIATSERYAAAVQDGRVLIDTAASHLHGAVGLLGDVRALLLQGMNGTLNAADRELLATEVRHIRDELLDIGNARTGDRALFAGTDVDSTPFTEQSIGGRAHVSYDGNHQAQEMRIGQEETIEVTLAGSDVFARREPTGTTFAGLTGAGPGQSADQGQGFDHLDVRHDGTSAALGAGLALVAGGANDTILGAHVLAVDAAAGTVRLDNGPARGVPAPGDPDVADFVVADENGAELHVDFSAWTGASATDAVTGDGSISMDGVNYATLDFVNDDLELTDSVTGAVLHVDTTGVRRAGSELVTFGGTVNAFDVLQGIADDLENVDGLEVEDVLDRLGVWLGELDRNSGNVLGATTVLGARSQRITATEGRLQEAGTQFKALLSRVEDADLSQAVLDLTRAEQTLELAQAAGVRLLQSSLLQFLR